jgi:RNA-directed DNA polymerase
VNVNSDYEIRARAAFHHWCRNGTYHVITSLEKAAAGDPFTVESEIYKLEGMLEWIYNVKESEDKRKSSAKRHNPTSFRKIYRQFLFAKNFVFSSRPLILCEGVTDNIYLASAIRKHAADFPVLGKLEPDGARMLVRFFHYSARSQNLLHLGGGAEDIANLLRDYRDLFDRVAKRKVQNPVFIIVDNDSGGKSVFDAIRNIGGPDIKITDNQIIFHIFHNVYLVKTPHTGSKHITCMEDMFDSSVRSTMLGVKSFKPDIEGETDNYYGKRIFAEAVVRPNWRTIDFTGFLPILHEIQAAIGSFHQSAGGKAAESATPPPGTRTA